MYTFLVTDVDYSIMSWNNSHPCTLFYPFSGLENNLDLCTTQTSMFHSVVFIFQGAFLTTMGIPPLKLHSAMPLTVPTRTSRSFTTQRWDMTYSIFPRVTASWLQRKASLTGALSWHRRPLRGIKRSGEGGWA